jgi:hypothetical protein
MACATGRPSLPHLAPLRRKNRFVYAKPPFAGPEAVLAYLSHREAGSRVQLAEAALREAEEIAPQQRTVFVRSVPTQRRPRSAWLAYAGDIRLIAAPADGPLKGWDI